MRQGCECDWKRSPFMWQFSVPNKNNNLSLGRWMKKWKKFPFLRCLKRRLACLYCKSSFLSSTLFQGYDRKKSLFKCQFSGYQSILSVIGVGNFLPLVASFSIVNFFKRQLFTESAQTNQSNSFSLQLVSGNFSDISCEIIDWVKLKWIDHIPSRDFRSEAASNQNINLCSVQWSIKLKVLLLVFENSESWMGLEIYIADHKARFQSKQRRKTQLEVQSFNSYFWKFEWNKK